MNIAVLLSGGVDSSVVVHLLCEQGHRPSLFYIQITDEQTDYMQCSMEEDLEMCRAVAHRYGLPLETVDLSREYREGVTAYMLEKIRQGLTPNPDVLCNRLIKFGCFYREAGHLFDRIATGHYAGTLDIEDKTWLTTAKDPVKDQTDFLAQIYQWQLRKLMFPLGGLLKEEVRTLASQAKLPTARRRDSQGICFLGNIPYNQFVRHYLGERPGHIVEWETGRILGTHRGYWFHTLGQRKGLGLSGGPWFVVKKDVRENLIYVSHGYDTPLQYGQHLSLTGFHFLTENPWTEASDPIPVTFKIRHTPEFLTGRLTPQAEGTYSLSSDTPLQGIAPGQFGVIYDTASRLCIGSGEITL